MSSPCTPNVTGKSDLKDNEAEQLLQRLKNRATIRAAQIGQPMDQALKDIAGEVVKEERMMTAINKRNALLTLQSKQNVKAYASRFGTYGEGLRALLEGSNKVVEGGRRSVDYQAKSNHGRYFGKLVADLEQANVMREFKEGDPDFVKQVYREMASFTPGQPSESVTGNQAAYKVAQIVDSNTEAMIARENRAGSFIRRAPGYIARQTHDMSTIRGLGDTDTGISKKLSFEKWDSFTRPLLDQEKTFQGADPNLIMRNIHEGIFTGVHGAPRDEANLNGVSTGGSLAKKVSAQRVLHFKGPDEAYAYNDRFGTRDFKTQVLDDIHRRSRNIAMMENFGPSPESTFQQIVRELQEKSRTQDDAAKQVDELKSWRLQTAWDEVSGKNSIPVNPTLGRISGTIRALTYLTKMGSVTISSLADKAFMQSEMAYQGISNLETLGKQITGMAKRSPEEVRMLRMMGLGMDRLIGNTLSRYAETSGISGWAHTTQKKFFDLNLMHFWTDANRSTVAELMSNHLGENSHLPFEKLPDDLRKVLSLYDIRGSSWDAIRSTAYEHEGNKFVTPDQIANVSEDKIKSLIEGEGRATSTANINRMRDQLETSLRTYLADRTDIAIPTPGAGERKFVTWGTRPGTPIGEAVRLMMMFKSWPTTVIRKIVGRTIYGNGADSLKDWLLTDHRGKFNLAMLMAMGTAAGYVSNSIRNGLQGKLPDSLFNEDGSINGKGLSYAAMRGGSLGILGDVLMSQYDHDTNSFLKNAAGPVLGQLEDVMDLKAKAQEGESIKGDAGKLLAQNSPFINLFYIRPIFNYFILWHLQEMMDPGSLRRQEQKAEDLNHQRYFMKPSELVNN